MEMEMQGYNNGDLRGQCDPRGTATKEAHGMCASLLICFIPVCSQCLPFL